MTEAKIQTRGHCQCCGHIQAVNGTIAKHGYTVEDGWFKGVCTGNRYEPIETHRDIADQVVHSVRAEVVSLRETLRKLKEGKVFPLTVQGRWNLKTREYDRVPFAEAPKYDQEHAVETEIWKNEQRANSGERFADQFEKLINRVHGQPLLRVPKPEAAPKIQAGEKRKNSGGRILEAKYQDGARVYWIDTTSKPGQTFKGWLGSRAWRGLELVK